MTHDQLMALPVALDVQTAAAVLGIGRTVAYELIRTDCWPSPVQRVGGCIRIPTAPLLELLGVTRDSHEEPLATARAI